MSTSPTSQNLGFFVIEENERVTYQSTQIAALAGWTTWATFADFARLICPPETLSFADFWRTLDLRELTMRIASERIPVGLQVLPISKTARLGILSFEREEVSSSRQFSQHGFELIESLRREKQLYSLAFSDPLTGLVNYNLLLLEIKKRLRTRTPFTLLRTDIYDSRSMANSLGARTAKKLTLTLARVVEDSVAEEDLVARVPGQGVFVLSNHEDRAKTRRLVERIFKAAKGTSPVPELRLNLKVVAGATVSKKDSLDPIRYFQNAGVAAEQAEREGSFRLRFFDRRVQTYLKTQFLMDTSLSQAFDKNELELYYQPIHALDGSGRVSCEALIRWNHPQKGLLLPSRFFEYIQDPRQCTQLDDWVLKHAFEQAKVLTARCPEVSISINVHPAYFGYTKFVDYIQNLLQTSGVDAQRLNIEITENALLENTEVALETIHELRRLGFGIMLDDFGTGYSSLSYLAQLPVDWIKIDKSFVDTLCRDPKQHQIVNMIIDMAKKMQAKTIAEGVEKKSQLQALQQMGCEAVQGYYFARPMPFEEVKSYLEQNANQ